MCVKRDRKWAWDWVSERNQHKILFWLRYFSTLFSNVFCLKCRVYHILRIIRCIFIYYLVFLNHIFFIFLFFSVPSIFELSVFLHLSIAVLWTVGVSLSLPWLLKASKVLSSPDTQRKDSWKANPFENPPKKHSEFSSIVGSQMARETIRQWQEHKK